MNCCFLSVSAVVFRITSDQLLSVEDVCQQFLTDSVQPHVHAEFLCVDCLPKVICKEQHRGVVWLDGLDMVGKYVRFFYDKPDSIEPYACSIWSADKEYVRIEYLSEERIRFTSLMNCFFYIGMEQILIRHDRIWPHAACVDTEFGGVLFSGPSGVGKSTQAELWCRYRGARQINGDRPILSKGPNCWLAWGAPYAGSSRCYVNDYCHVSAIVMLQQAKQCSLHRLGAADAFREVWKGLALYSWDRDFMDRASTLTMELISQVPVYIFECTPDENAVFYLEEKLRKEIVL